MCGNRVDELESRVQELEASVEGLTDELVECKVRLRELEAAVDEDLGFVPERRTDRTDRTDGADQEADQEDIRVPEPGESQDAAEGTKTEAPEGDDNAEDSESDIIVA